MHVCMFVWHANCPSCVPNIFFGLVKNVCLTYSYSYGYSNRYMDSRRNSRGSQSCVQDFPLFLPRLCRHSFRTYAHTHVHVHTISMHRHKPTHKRTNMGSRGIVVLGPFSQTFPNFIHSFFIIYIHFFIIRVGRMIQTA